MILKTTICVLAATTFGLAQPSGAPTPLAYIWVKDRPLTYNVTQEGVQKISGLPMGDADQSVRQNITLVMNPKEVAPDGTATIEVVYSAVRLEMQPMMQPKKFAYDSANPGADNAPNPLAGPVMALVGQAFTVVLGPDGAVKSLDGVQPIVEKMTQAGAGSGSSAIGQLLKGVFSEPAVTKLFENGFHRLPDQPVEVGGGWDAAYDMPDTQMGRLKAASRSILTSLESGIATIDTTATISLEPPASGQPVNPMMRNMKLGDAKGVSTTLFDAGRGLLRRYSGKVTIPVSSSTPPGGTGQAMTISIAIDNSTTLELSEPK